MPFRKSADSTRSTRSRTWLGGGGGGGGSKGSGKPPRGTGPRMVDREARLGFLSLSSTLSSRFPWGKSRSKQHSKEECDKASSTPKKEPQAKRRGSLPSRLETDPKDPAIDSKSSWESTCTPSFPSDRASDHGLDSPARRVARPCVPPGSQRERTSGANPNPNPDPDPNLVPNLVPNRDPDPDDVRDILTSSQMSPRVHRALYSVLSAGVNEGSVTESLPRKKVHADRTPASASGSLPGGRRLPTFWKRSTRRRVGSSMSRRISGAWREREDVEAFGSVASSQGSERMNTDLGEDSIPEPIPKRGSPRLTKTELRKHLNATLAQNSQLKQTISQLVMDDVEVTTLRKRVTDLEWALDVVADDANRIRDEAFEALANSDARMVDHGFEKREQVPGYDQNDSEDEWETRSAARQLSVERQQPGKFAHKDSHMDTDPARSYASYPHVEFDEEMPGRPSLDNQHEHPFSPSWRIVCSVPPWVSHRYSQSCLLSKTLCKFFLFWINASHKSTSSSLYLLTCARFFVKSKQKVYRYRIREKVIWNCSLFCDSPTHTQVCTIRPGTLRHMKYDIYRNLLHCSINFCKKWMDSNKLWTAMLQFRKHIYIQ